MSTAKNDPPVKTATGRWVSARFLVKLANWLAVSPLKKAHDGTRVGWSFATARIFAYRALRAGHDSTTIEAHYRAAVAAVNAESCQPSRGAVGVAVHATRTLAGKISS